MINFFRVFFLLLLFHNVSGQTVQLTISNENNEPVNNGFILINSVEKPANSLHFISFRQNTVVLPVATYNEALLLIIKSNGYINDTIHLKKEELKQPKHFNVFLKIKSTELKELVIEAKQKPYKIKNDTVVYKLSGYADGTERKLEDILKKLPGVEVNNSTGQIKYKGREIETIMLEGDNLFGKDYTIGSKNLNVDLVDEVEGIDNYIENSLLKGFDTNEKTALNLKLKKDAFGVNVEAVTGAGTIKEEKIANDLASAILTVNSAVKSFAVLSNNNIGIERSSLNYYTNIGPTGFGDVPSKIITDGFPANQINKNYNYNNNQFLTDINTVFSPSSKVKVKLNGSFINDNIDISSNSFNKYIIENQTIENDDTFFTSKKNQFFKGNINLNYSLNKRSNLEWDSNAYNNPGSTSNNIVSASSLINNYDVISNSTFLKNYLNYTNKLNNNNVLIILFKHNYNSIKQDMIYNDSVDFEKKSQQSKIKRSNISLFAELFGKGIKTKYSISIGYENEATGFLSSQKSGANHNDSKVITDIFLNNLKYQIIINRWSYLLSSKFSILNQKLQDNIASNNKQTTNLIIEPSASLNFTINKISFLNITANYNQSPMAKDYLYINSILTDNRNAISANTSLNISKNLNVSLIYSRNDLFYQFENTISLDYQKNNGDFISRSLINENFITTNYFFGNVDNNDFNANYMISKYVPVINSTLKYNVSYNYSVYNNFINESDLRKNTNHIIDNELFVKTAFETAFNFENSFNYRINRSIGNENEIFTNKSLNNNFKVIFKEKSITSTLEYNYFLPDTHTWGNNYNFLDFTTRYIPKSKKYEISFIANNMLNIQSFSTTQTSDTSLSKYSTTIIPRQFLIKLSYRF